MTLKMFIPTKTFPTQQQERHLRIGVHAWDIMSPECMLKYRRNCDPGPELEIFTVFMLLLHFTVEIKYSTTPGCGTMNPQGVWNGVLGMLQRNEVDVVGNLCALDGSRMNQSWLKYSWPVLQEKQAFLIKVPAVDSVFHIMAPFTCEVWIALTTALPLVLGTFASTYYFSKRFTFRLSIGRACSDMFNIIFGFDCSLIASSWYYYLCFVGFFFMMYSAFITVVVLKSPDIEKPFKGHIDLADSLSKGIYKQIDNKIPPNVIRCYDPKVCSSLQKTVKRNGFHSVDTNSLVTFENNNRIQKYSGNALLNELKTSFSERENLWLLNDDDSGAQWYSYFYRNDSNISSLFDKVLILMGDSKRNIYKRYLGLSHFAPHSNVIKGEFLPDKTRLNMKLMYRLFASYVTGIAIGVTALFFEILHANRRKKTFKVLQIPKYSRKN